MLQKSASIEPWKDTQKLSNQLSINVAPCVPFVQHEYESEANQSLDLAEKYQRKGQHRTSQRRHQLAAQDQIHAEVGAREESEQQAVRGVRRASDLVERFDIEPYSDFSAKW